MDPRKASPEPLHVLVAGAGWLGSAVADRLAARGHRVTAVRRDPRRAAALARPGVTPLALDLLDPAAPGHLPADLTAIVACQSADGEGGEAYRRAYVEANRVLLEVARARGRDLHAFVYTGSTGVFGQRDGGDVDERTPPAPAGPAGEALLEAERLVLDAAARGLPASVLRLSGLYGPGRAWPVERVRAGLLRLGPGDGAWMNLLPLEDAVAAVVAAVERAPAGRVLHATDAASPRRRELVEWVAARLGIPAPRAPEGAAPPAAPDRRILGEASRRELGLVLRYPSFREGVEALLSSGAA
jgi:nucleoside-diphosphate-sugar epimerase